MVIRPKLSSKPIVSTSHTLPLDSSVYLFAWASWRFRTRQVLCSIGFRTSLQWLLWLIGWLFVLCTYASSMDVRNRGFRDRIYRGKHLFNLMLLGWRLFLLGFFCWLVGIRFLLRTSKFFFFDFGSFLFETGLMSRPPLVGTQKLLFRLILIFPLFSSYISATNIGMVRA